MRHNEGTFVGCDGLKIYCQAWLPDDTPTASLIIVHGLGEHSGRYMNLVRKLVPNRYAVYAFDNRGHGRSPGRRGHVRSFSEYRQDIDAFTQFLDANEKLKRPLFLMGHSLGGLIVLEAVLLGMSGLAGVILSAPALDSGGVSPILMTASKVVSRLWPTLSVKTGLDITGISRDPEVLTAYRMDLLVHGLGTPRLATESSKAMSTCFENVDQLQIPVLILHGTSDRITSPQRSREFFDHVTVSDKTYMAYDGGFHESHNDLHHEQAVQDVLNWLDKHLSNSNQ
jgi:alpha-beta hydrolase superfamily lysophospholipase